MSARVERSGRRSDRVVEQAPGVTGLQALQAIRAPESVTTGGARARVAERRAGRVSARRLESLAGDLSAREQAVLRSVDKFRFLTTRQLERLHFTDHASPQAAARICRRVLARLDSLRVLEHLERRVGGIRAGSASYVWRVGPIGDRLLRRDEGQGTPRRRKEPSARHLDHCLAIADCYITLIQAERLGTVELLSVATEPTSWRSYLASSGVRETLKPDLYVVTATGQYEDHWFIEVDRGTESLPTLINKCRQYERYRRSGVEQTERGVFPRVLWVLPSETHLNRLQEAVRADHRLDAELFRLTTSPPVLEPMTGAQP